VERHLVADQDDVPGEPSQAGQAVADIALLDRAVGARHDGNLVLARRIDEDESHAVG